MDKGKKGAKAITQTKSSDRKPRSVSKTAEKKKASSSKGKSQTRQSKSRERGKSTGADKGKGSKNKKVADHSKESNAKKTRKLLIENNQIKGNYEL